jgi:hypothetical protein
MTYGNLNVDTVTTSTAGGVLGAGNASIMKNRIINGAMVIDQRNAGASVTNNSGAALYPVDRFFIYGNVSSKFTAQQNAGSVTPPAGFTNYIGITSLSAYSVGAGDTNILGQGIEGYNIADLGWGTANAKTVTLSFWVYSSLTGTFGGAVQNNAQNRSYPFSYTISSANTWELKSITIAGDTSGTWLATNGKGIQLTFGLGVGSTGSGTAGAWAGANYSSATGATSVVGTNLATFYITGVQLEVGSSATGFEYRQYGQELALCQRYYTKLTAGSSLYTAFGSGFFLSTTAGAVSVSLPTAMRATPSASVNLMEFSTFSANFNISAISTTYLGPYGGYVTAITTGATLNQPCILCAQGSTAGYIDFSAEL